MTKLDKVTLMSWLSELNNSKRQVLTLDASEVASEALQAAGGGQVTRQTTTLPTGVLPAQHLLLRQVEALTLRGPHEGLRTRRVGCCCPACG